MNIISTCTQVGASPEILVALLTLEDNPFARVETLSLVSLYIATPVVMSNLSQGTSVVTHRGKI